MKTIKEKAERYDKAIIAFKPIYDLAKEQGRIIDVQEFERIFPELKESDDRIRKEILEYFQQFKNKGLRGINISDWIAWLENQCEQKSIDELTQQEAMDIAVAKCFEQGGQKPAECRQETKPNGGIVYEDFNEGDGYYKVNLEYLSKSQVELIENLVASWQTSSNNSVEWSEEDEKEFEQLLNILHTNGYESFDNWLKSLKDRVQPQPKQEWSEEDIATISRVISIVKWAAYSDHSHPVLNDEGATELIERLKSLKERYTWKPSDKQINALKKACDEHWEPDGLDPLYTLYQDLKKLREDKL